jgi:hypothetical protein
VKGWDLEVFSGVVSEETTLMVGASFAGMTVTVKEVAVVSTPSVTLTVMVAEPVAFGAGVTVSRRLLPDPSRTIDCEGISAVFELVADRDRRAEPESSSTVKAMPERGMSSGVVWLAIALITGAVFAVVTVIWTVVVAEADPSLAAKTTP